MPYDLVVAADSFVYLGDLSPTFASARRQMKPGATFLFTVERHQGQGYKLSEKRRWRHSENYVRQTAALGGFEVSALLECSPRREAGAPVEGLACALRLPESESEGT